MKKRIMFLVVLLLVFSLLGGLVVYAEEVPNVEITEEVVEEVKPDEDTIELEAPDTKEYVVKRLEHGVTVFLEADVAIRRAWSKSFTFDIDRNFEDESTHTTTGFWFGNGITSYWITYSRNVHTEDPGRASFSFSYAF